MVTPAVACVTKVISEGSRVAADAEMDLQDVAAVGGRKLTAGGEPRPRLGAKTPMMRAAFSLKTTAAAVWRVGCRGLGREACQPSKLPRRLAAAGSSRAESVRRLLNRMVRVTEHRIV
jgi:hypothetical protein